MVLLCNPSPQVAKSETVWFEASLGCKRHSEELHSKKELKERRGAEFAARRGGLCVTSDDRVSPLCRRCPAVFRAENDVRSHGVSAKQGCREATVA